jgi:hypothetical protein
MKPYGRWRVAEIIQWLFPLSLEFGARWVPIIPRHHKLSHHTSSHADTHDIHPGLSRLKSRLSRPASCSGRILYPISVQTPGSKVPEQLLWIVVKNPDLCKGTRKFGKNPGSLQRPRVYNFRHFCFASNFFQVILSEGNDPLGNRRIVSTFLS